MQRPPDLVLPAELRRMFNAREPGLADRIEARVQELRRPCVYFKSQRVSPHPLRRSRLGRLFGKDTSAPSLPVATSKFGGRPYCETEEDWNGWRFLGQIDLTEATRLLPRTPLKGLVRIDVTSRSLPDCFRVRWFPEPDEARAIKLQAPESVGKWEVRHEFKLGWSLPHDEANWFSLVQGMDELWDAWNEWEPPGFDEDGRDEYHTILGWPAGRLEEHYGFESPAVVATSLLTTKCCSGSPSTTQQASTGERTGCTC